MNTYKPRLYHTSALTQVKVNLTWDETDPGREEAIRAAHAGKFDDSKLDHYLASSSSEAESGTHLRGCHGGGDSCVFRI